MSSLGLGSFMQGMAGGIGMGAQMKKMQQTGSDGAQTQTPPMTQGNGTSTAVSGANTNGVGLQQISQPSTPSTNAGGEASSSWSTILNIFNGLGG